jgi:dsRNA-specific ribonuclease
LRLSGRKFVNVEKLLAIVTILEAFIAGLLVAPCLWFVAKWIERARDPELESIERQRREEDRLRRLRRRSRR